MNKEQNMNDCEPFEGLVSEWLDEELDRAGQVEMLDHLARCNGCRRFYTEARALAGVVAAVRTPADAPAPSLAVWKRIKDAGAPSRPSWAWGAVAAAILAVGFMLVLVGQPVPIGPQPGDVEIQLGSNSGNMTDQRFIALATEVLQSDQRYRAAMFQVMSQVMTETGAQEASFEGLSPRVDREEPGEDRSIRRTPA